MLPVFPKPVPGEALSSYTIRLALANGMRPMRLTAVLGLTTFWKRDPDVSVTPEEIAVLAKATGLPVERLLACSVMPLLAGLHENPSSVASPRFLVMTGKHRGLQGVRGHPICPRCVRETGAVSRHWRLTTSVVCERHGTPLVDTCPACQTPVHHARVHLTRANRMRVMEHHPEACSGCGEPLPDPEPLDSDTLNAALRVQHLMAQATQAGTVEWGGLRLDAREFQGILESVLRMHYPSKAASGQAKWRPETVSVKERLPIMVAGGRDLRGGLLDLLRVWRSRGVMLTDILKTGVPEWFRGLAMLALSTDGRNLPPVTVRCKTFTFTERQWRIVSEVLPPVARTSKGRRKPDRHVLCAWFTRNIKLTRQADWTGKWTGNVSYPALYRRITRMMEEGVLDRVVEHMLTHLPECRPAVTAPGTVYSLSGMGSRHADRLWTMMVEDRLLALQEGGPPPSEEGLC